MDTTLNTKPEPHRKRYLPTIVLALLALIFIGPMVLAWNLYTYHQTWFDDTINYGQLISPPLALSKLALFDENQTSFDQQPLAGHWQLLYVNPGACGSDCQAMLHQLRQVNVALGANQDRVQRLLVTINPTALVLSPALKNRYPELRSAGVTAQQLSVFLASQPFRHDVLQQGGLFLVDPVGNVMMFYDTQATGKGLLKDLNRLLKVSSVG